MEFNPLVGHKKLALIGISFILIVGIFSLYFKTHNPSSLKKENFNNKTQAIQPSQQKFSILNKQFKNSSFKFSFRYPSAGEVFSGEEFSGPETAADVGLKLNDSQALRVFAVINDIDLKTYANAVAMANHQVKDLVVEKIGEAKAYTFSMEGTGFTNCINSGSNGHEVCGYYTFVGGTKKISIVDGGMVKLIFIYPQNNLISEEVFKTAQVSNFRVFSLDEINWKDFSDREFSFSYPDVYDLTIPSSLARSQLTGLYLSDSGKQNFLPLPWVAISVFPVSEYTVGLGPYGIKWSYNPETDEWLKQETQPDASKYVFPKKITSKNNRDAYYFNISYENGPHHLLVLPFRDKILELSFTMPPSLFNQKTLEDLEGEFINRITIK